MVEAERFPHGFGCCPATDRVISEIFCQSFARALLTDTF
jgi:hypothetical protein